MSAQATQEQAVVFGRYGNLVGVVNLPDGAGETAVLMLNAGMLPSPGPFRLHVDLARSLAEVGVASLRFDLSGIGESLAVGTSGTSLERAAAEVSAAVDCLEQQHGIRRVVLFGLCSGADDALHAALHDTRVVGIYALDGLGYRTPKYYRQRLLDVAAMKLANPEKWVSWTKRLFGRQPPLPGSLQQANDIREFPGREEALQQLQALAERGVTMHFHYTGGVESYYNYSNQFHDMFPELFSGQAPHAHQFSTSFERDSDHVYFLCEHRQALVSFVTRRLTWANGSVPVEWSGSHN